MKIWIDTDTGIDDAIALSLAILSKKFEIIGITGVHGNVDVENATINALTITKLFGESIQVWKGSPHNLIGKSYPYAECHGKDGLADVITSKRTCDYSKGFGPHILADYLFESKEPICVVALGPLTNIALALSYRPDCFQNGHSLVIMGGAMLSEGNETASSEFNIWCDPEAAYKIVHSGIEQTWISLDITMKTLMPLEWCKKMMKADEEFKRILGKIGNYYSKWYKKMYKFDGFALHDPLTIGYLLWPDLFTIQPSVLDVELCGNLSRGKTIPDFYNGNFSKGQINARIATNVDSKMFIERFELIMS